MRPEYWVYQAAKKRCNNPQHKQYKNYGGRGIKFLFKSFDEFMNRLGPRPEGLTLDRINNDGHYEPGNVRWASMKEQARNKRGLKLSYKTLREVAILKRMGVKTKDIARAYELKPATLENAISGKSWAPDNSIEVIEFSAEEKKYLEVVGLFRESRRKNREIGV